jgi:hypothetical protein
MERLTDVPGFRRVQHRPKSSARVPRKKKISVKSVVAISEPRHVAAAEHCEG